MATSLVFAPGIAPACREPHQRGRVRSAGDCEQKHWKCRERRKQPWASASRTGSFAAGERIGTVIARGWRAISNQQFDAIGLVVRFQHSHPGSAALLRMSATGALQFPLRRLLHVGVALGYLRRSRQASRRRLPFPSARERLTSRNSEIRRLGEDSCLVDTLRKDSAASR